MYGSIAARRSHCLPAAAALALAGVFAPSDSVAASYRPPSCTTIEDADGRALDYACPSPGRLRIWAPFSAIPRRLRELVVMLEDDKFYVHGGLDAEGIGDAVKANLKEGRLARGGSTITQQLVKNLFLTKEKSFLRKIREIPLALKMERDLTKDQILELYLNTIEWGPGIYGAEAAARLYFDHRAHELSEEECWLMALMIPNPKELNLWAQPRGKKSLLSRARTLSERLWREKHMGRAQAEDTLSRFEAFLDRWAAGKPVHPWAKGRRYPAHWERSPLPGLWTVAGLHRKLAPRGAAAMVTPLLWDWQRELAELRIGMEPPSPTPSPAPSQQPAAFLPSPSALDLALHSLTAGLFAQPTPTPTPTPKPRIPLTPRPTVKKEPVFHAMVDDDGVLRALIPAKKQGALGLSEAAARLTRGARAQKR